MEGCRQEESEGVFPELRRQSHHHMGQSERTGAHVLMLKGVK